MKFLKKFFNQLFYHCPSNYGLKESVGACMYHDCDMCWKMALESNNKEN